ncbi:hypothetical protein F66182_9615 [Fusarium sp. NRRL 66182]|nr:hypothetical protein F66182_9615 [Fusarium sp. NRRL 66182]
MRRYIPLLLALSAYYTTITALPQPRIAPREPQTEPKYSVVPLEPGDDDPASGGLGSGDGGSSGGNGNGNGNGGGSGDEDGDGIVTIIQTVVRTRKPVTHTHIITHTKEPDTITAPGKTVTKPVPTTVSVVDVNEEPVTETVTVIPQPSTARPEPSKESKPLSEPETTANKPRPTAQNTSKSLSSVAAPGVTSRPQPEPQPNPQPKPESTTIIEPPKTTESLSPTTYNPSTPPPVETVAQPPPAIESSAGGLDPTTLLTLTSHNAGVPEKTAIPSSDYPVAPVPPQETGVGNPETQRESWSTVAVPYVPPAAPTTLATFTITTTSSAQSEAPGSTSPSKTHDDGAWHTSYPAWNGTVLSV